MAEQDKIISYIQFNSQLYEAKTPTCPNLETNFEKVLQLTSTSLTQDGIIDEQGRLLATILRHRLTFNLKKAIPKAPMRWTILDILLKNPNNNLNHLIGIRNGLAMINNIVVAVRLTGANQYVTRPISDDYQAYFQQKLLLIGYNQTSL